MPHRPSRRDRRLEASVRRLLGLIDQAATDEPLAVLAHDRDLLVEVLGLVERRRP